MLIKLRCEYNACFIQDFYVSFNADDMLDAWLPQDFSNTLGVAWHDNRHFNNVRIIF